VKQKLRSYFSSSPRWFWRFMPLLLLCVATTSSAAIIDVTRWGAIPNDSRDDSAAIQRAINAAPDGSTIYFPKGTYLLSNVTIDHRSGLTLTGDGSTLTLLKHHGYYLPIFISTGSTDMLITKLGFDTNGVRAFGGFNFYNSKRITITKNHFFDSNPQPAYGRDRYSWVFCRGTVLHEDIVITDNLIEDLQLEVDFSIRARIEGNTIVRPVTAGGIGIYSVADNGFARQYTIQKNTIVDAVVSIGAIVVGLDPPTDSASTMKTFRILDNHIVYTKYVSDDHSNAIRLGTGDRTQATVGNVFDDIVIQNNVIYKDPSSPYDFFHPVIFGNSSPTANFRFDNTQISNNTIYYNNRFGQRIIYITEKGANYLEKDNRVYSISSDVMPPSVPTALTTTHVSDNQIHLAWNSSVDNVEVDGYHIYRNGSKIGSASGTSYVDGNVVPRATYTYTVTAVDSSGTESAQSYSTIATTASATTLKPTPPPTPIEPTPITGGQPSLTATPGTIPGGATITATWSGIASPRSTAWLGLYRPGAANTSYIYWVYVSCSQKTPGAPRSSGSCPLRVASSLPPGTYELRLFNEGYKAIATSNGFVLAASLTGGPTTITAGNTLTATWKGPASATPMDWIGLYQRGASNGWYLAWMYVSCSKSPSIVRASGSCPFVVPASLRTGAYELRLFTNGSTTLAISNSLAIRSASDAR
jgi:Pectate lyase superfamily protein